MASEPPSEGERPTPPTVTPATVAARLSTLHREVHLPDAALVVRGGALRLDDLVRTAANTEVKMQGPGVSVYAADVADPSILLELVGARLPHTILSFTTAGRLRAKNFDIEQTLEPPHHTVWLPESTDREFWLREFRSAFDPPIRRAAVQSYRVQGH